MREIEARSSYKQDYKLVKKQGWDLYKIDDVLTELQTADVLSDERKEHQLQGNMRFYRECHVFGDLVIIYQRDETTLTLYRIGRHQELFKKY